MRLIGAAGDQLGIFQTRDAIKKAREEGFDLVEISPKAKPPVCRIMDYGKYKYELSKKQHEAKKKQVVIHVKEIQVRPSTGEHDLQTKLSHLKKFLVHGDKAKINVKFRGREMAHQDMGRKLLDRMIAELSAYGEVEQMPRREGKTLFAVIGPIKKR